MPSYVHHIRIVETNPSAAINNGNSLAIIPTSNQITVYGAGSAVVGDASATANIASSTEVDDSDFIDDSIVKTGGAG